MPGTLFASLGFETCVAYRGRPRAPGPPWVSTCSGAGGTTCRGTCTPSFCGSRGWEARPAPGGGRVKVRRWRWQGGDGRVKVGGVRGGRVKVYLHEAHADDEEEPAEDDAGGAAAPAGEPAGDAHHEVAPEEERAKRLGTWCGIGIGSGSGSGSGSGFGFGFGFRASGLGSGQAARGAPRRRLACPRRAAAGGCARVARPRSRVTARSTRRTRGSCAAPRRPRRGPRLVRLGIGVGVGVTVRVRRRVRGGVRGRVG